MPQLVLTRREGEEIVILDTIGHEIARVRVASIRGDKVRLAVEASLRFGVHRSEVWDAIKAEKAGVRLAGNGPAPVHLEPEGTPAPPPKRIAGAAA